MQVENMEQAVPAEPVAEPATESPPIEEMFNLDIDLGPIMPEPLLPLWDFLQNYPVVLVVLMFALGYGIGKALHWLLQTLLRQATSRTKTKLDDHLVNYLTAPVVPTTVVLALMAVVKSFGFSDGIDWLLVRALLTLLLFFWGRSGFKAATLLISTLSKDADRFKLFQPRTRPLFEMGIKIFLFTVLLWIFMLLWNIDGTAWLASAGVLGIAIGFAAKDTLANLISGVSIIADAPYKLGDYIVLDTGERGVVTELGMRSTRLLTRDDVEISIPNAVMGNAKITNESGGPAVEHRIRIPIGVAYGTDPTKVVEILEKIAHDDEMILSLPTPRVRMRGFGASSLDFQLMGWIRYPEQRGLATHRLLIEIDKRFREEGIQIPFPQQDVHIKEIPGTEKKPGAEPSG